ncbi:hypothetical protein HMPREF1529_02702 [Microbacterium sp. oral taxon 186 str. F0373]|nr:hypothetical protein HMPREF1529_02702 [Microbacterium sp. oral taxon 186 str. F0373]
MATIKFTIPDDALLEHLAATHGFSRGDANNVEVESSAP